ncbi:transcriptional regulator domain-containing protein [Parvibaculum sp.]|uniref:transcriptional regulator domain-containing protein n=1 Tax=Parvibaculum sp. TaxID=2024848 RepID=UPI003918EF4A
MTPDISHWRSSERYEYVEGLVSPELAWEWLRRNEDYQRDFEAAQLEPNADTAATEATRSRWGLRFPVVACPRRQGGRAHLGTHLKHRRRCADRAASHPTEGCQTARH